MLGFAQIPSLSFELALLLGYNVYADLLPAPKRLPAERLALRPAKRGHLPALWQAHRPRTHLQPCNGTGSHSCSMGPRSMHGLSPRSHDTCGVHRNQKPQRKIPRQLQRRSMTCTGLCQERVQAAVPFTKGFDDNRISHRHRVSAGTPCTANASRRT